MQSGRAVSALYAARFAALSRDPRGAAGTFLSRRIAAGKEKYPEKKPGTLIFSSGTAFKFTKAAVRRPEPRLFFPHLKRRRERKAAQKKGLGSRRRGGNVVLVHPAFGERGRPRARRRAARKAQRAAKPSRCEFCNSPQRPFRSRNTGPPFGATDRQNPTAQHSFHKPNSHNSPPKSFPRRQKIPFSPYPRLIQRGALRMHVSLRCSSRTGAQAIRAHDFFSGRFS